PYFDYINIGLIIYLILVLNTLILVLIILILVLIISMLNDFTFLLIGPNVRIDSLVTCSAQQSRVDDCRLRGRSRGKYLNINRIQFCCTIQGNLCVGAVGRFWSQWTRPFTVELCTKHWR